MSKNKLVFVKKITCAQNVQNLTLVGDRGFLFKASSRLRRQKKTRNLNIQCIPVIVPSDIVPICCPIFWSHLLIVNKIYWI